MDYQLVGCRDVSYIYTSEVSVWILWLEYCNLPSSDIMSSQFYLIRVPVRADHDIWVCAVLWGLNSLAFLFVAATKSLKSLFILQPHSLTHSLAHSCSDSTPELRIMPWRSKPCWKPSCWRSWCLIDRYMSCLSSWHQQTNRFFDENCHWSIKSSLLINVSSPFFGPRNNFFFWLTDWLMELIMVCRLEEVLIRPPEEKEWSSVGWGSKKINRRKKVSRAHYGTTRRVYVWVPEGLVVVLVGVYRG